MATPTCPKCDSTRFEAQIFEPSNANYKLNAINCLGCGAVVGVVEYSNLGVLIRKLAKGLNIKID